MAYQVSRYQQIELLARCLIKHGSVEMIQREIDFIHRSGGDATVSVEFIATNGMTPDILEEAEKLMPTLEAEYERSERSPVWIPQAILSILILIAFLDMPYGYYILLRWICFMSLFPILIFACFENKKLPLMWVFITFLGIYNPIIKLGMERETWEIVNILTLITLGISVCFLSKKRAY